MFFVLVALELVFSSNGQVPEAGSEGTTMSWPLVRHQNAYFRIFCTAGPSNWAVLTCSFYSSLKVLHMNYLRNVSTYCPQGVTSDETCNEKEVAKRYTKHAQEICNGKRECEYKFPNYEWGIPSNCRHLIKYFEVHYECEPCGHFTYGINCDKKCYCMKGRCDPVTGTCPDGVCMTGWHGKNCDQPCRKRTYGPNCEKRCHCKEESCHPGTGMCTGFKCQSGWKGFECNQPCLPGTYGEGCTKNCSSFCLNCNKIKGCTVCIPGRTGLPSCEAGCPLGTYGFQCLECGMCEMRTRCHILLGHCLGGCESGWTGLYCKKPCPDGFYGKECKKSCGKCKNNELCLKASGICPLGCTFGYIGALCTQILWVSLAFVAVPFIWVTVLPLFCRMLSFSRESMANQGYGIHTNNTSSLAVRIKTVEQTKNRKRPERLESRDSRI